MILETKAAGQDDVRVRCSKLVMTAEQESDVVLLTKLRKAVLDHGTDWLRDVVASKFERRK